MGRIEREGPLKGRDPSLVRLSRQAVDKVDADIREARPYRCLQSAFRAGSRVASFEEGKINVGEGLDAETQAGDAEGFQQGRRLPVQVVGVCFYGDLGVRGKTEVPA